MTPKLRLGNRRKVNVRGAILPEYRFDLILIKKAIDFAATSEDSIN
jgi:hypothetical protein